MTAELLLHKFDRVAETAGGLPRLRRFVLDLAARGRLVPQDPSESSATDLLAQITARNLAVRSTAIGDRHARSPVTHVEEPFAVPSSWVWVRLGDVLAKLTDGTHHSPPNVARGPYRYITAKNVKPDGVTLDAITYVTADVHAEIYARCNPEPGDVLYIKDGATTGVVTINDLAEPFSMLSSVALLKLLPGLYNRLLVTFLRAPFFYDQMRGQMKGSALPRVTLTRMAPALVPLPPLAEQHRIVGKVDELMALCDELEVAQTEREARRHRLRTTSLRYLAAPGESKDGARFLLRNARRMITKPEHVAGVRQAILDLAVRGRLVPQEAGDVAAESMLSRPIVLPPAARRRRKILRKGSNVAPSPHAGLPKGWSARSVRELYDLNIIIDYADGNHGSLYPRKNEFGAGGVNFVSAKDISHGRVNWNSCAKLNSAKASQLVKGWAVGGDILLTHNATVGRVARVEQDVAPFLLGTSVTFYRLNQTALAGDFFYLYLLSSSWQDQLRAVMAQTTRNQVSIQKQAEFHVRIPPVSEQLRIVANADKLLTLCDELEQSLATEQTERARLLESLLHDALGDPVLARDLGS